MLPALSRLIGLSLALVLYSFAALAQDESGSGDLPNLHQITPTFYRGGQPTTNGMALLRKAGIKTIINLRAADYKSTNEEQVAKAVGLQYFNIPMDGWSRPTDAQIQAALVIIHTPENQPVFLHCRRGKDRTGTIVACCRILDEHWHSADAIKEARSLGMAWSEFGMKRYIRDFERAQIQGAMKTIAAGNPAKHAKPIFKATP